MLMSFLILELRRFSYARDLTWKPEIDNISVWILTNIYSELINDPKYDIGVRNWCFDKTRKY